MSTLSFGTSPAPFTSAQAPNSSSKPSDAFFRDLSMCPDGSCVLAHGEDRSLSLFPIPLENPASPSLPPSWTHQPPDSLLSTAWYPGASVYDPSMFCFAVGVKDHPVHLLDANDPSRVRASYPIIDHTERFVAPHSMLFSPDGASLYCSFDNAIEIFDVNSPGAEGFRLSTTPTRGSRSGQKGIISTLAFSSPDPLAPSSSPFLAAGSFSGSIGLYDPSSPAPLFDLLTPSQKGGVTKVAFNPVSPHLLFAASRNASNMDVWDLRNASRPVSHGKMRREGRTNQQLGFDIDPTGTWLATGDQNGTLSIFSAQPLPSELEPVTTFSLSTEPLAATLFHPSLPLLLTASGTRRFRQVTRGRRRRGAEGGESSGESSEEEDEGEAEEEEMEGEASLRIWSLT